MAEEEVKEKEDAADTSEETEEGEDGEEGGKKKSKLPIIIIAVVLLLGGGAGAYFGGLIGGGDKADTEASDEEHGDDHGKKDDGHGDDKGDGEEGGEQGEGATSAGKGYPVYYDMPEFLVNLNTGGKRTSFLKMRVTLELGETADVAMIDAYKPRVLDAFNTYLRELRMSDLKGSQGLYRLRQELMLRINKELGEDKVKYILFKDVIIQ